MKDITKIRLVTDCEKFFTEFEDEIKLFRHRVVLDPEGAPFNVTVNFNEEENTVEASVECSVLSENTYKITEKTEQFSNYISKTAKIKRIAKAAVYKFLSDALGEEAPYGSLTGIRPTKLYHEFVAKGADADGELTRLYVSPSKLALIKEIVDTQRAVYDVAEDEADLFVNIPICTSRCAYCSFISAELGRVSKYVPEYASLLAEEIAAARKMMADTGVRIRCVYVGGGTPTSLPDGEFAKVMEALAGTGCREFTVEAGRPDTITESKLKIMDETGVSRISVNPQSFCDATLERIGRKHTVRDFYEKYELASKFSFDINVDLIAMLPGETVGVFADSVDRAVALAPANLTVHTLALKKGSALKLGNYDNTSESDAAAMVDHAYSAAKRAGYAPYYMYRQKYMSGNLENVGYCLPGKQCVYNVDIMEETATIVACGAGGISKLVDRKAGRVERYADPKGLDVYLARGEEIWRRKEAFFASGGKTAQSDSAVGKSGGRI